MTSLPTRERELKPTDVGEISVSALSLPTRERELKRLLLARAGPLGRRSPRGSVN